MKRTAGSADGLFFQPVHGRGIREGYYLARRRDWSRGRSWLIVFVWSREVDGEIRTGVFQPCSADPEPLADWVFRSKLLGITGLPAHLPPPASIDSAVVLH